MIEVDYDKLCSFLIGMIAGASIAFFISAFIVWSFQ